MVCFFSIYFTVILCWLQAAILIRKHLFVFLFFFLNDIDISLEWRMQSVLILKSHKILTRLLLFTFSGLWRYYFLLTPSSYFEHRHQCRWETTLPWRYFYSFCVSISQVLMMWMIFFHLLTTQPAHVWLHLLLLL